MVLFPMATCMGCIDVNGAGLLFILLYYCCSSRLTPQPPALHSCLSLSFPGMSEITREGEGNTMPGTATEVRADRFSRRISLRKRTSNTGSAAVARTGEGSMPLSGVGCFHSHSNMATLTLWQYCFAYSHFFQPLHTVIYSRSKWAEWNHQVMQYKGGGSFWQM